MIFITRLNSMLKVLRFSPGIPLKAGLTYVSCWLIILVSAACQTNPPLPAQSTAIQNPSAAVTPRAVAQATPTPLAATCADIDATWGQNWPAALDTLAQLIAANQSCGEEPLLSKKYAAHYIYGVALEEKNEVEPAIAQYQAALAIDPQRKEARDALFRLDALPKPTPPACLSTSAPRPDPAPATAPDPSQFITVQGDQLQLNGQPFKVKGLNYYPRHAPWQRFLKESDPTEMAKELDLIKGAGFNTLRLFLWYEPLFTCQPEDAIPNEAAFAVIDRLFELAGERDLKLIITLNDLPDLMFRPLYTDFAHYDNQTIYIVRRYRNEPSLLAWDVRNEGDIDYGAQSAADARFSQAEVIDWLAHISQAVRDNDPYHLVTASWWDDPTPTGPYVDILSFHHWNEANQLQVRINEYRQTTPKPLLLQIVGYHSGANSPDERQNEQSQADTLGHVARVAEAQNSGWIIWTAFDFVPAPGHPPTEEHFFGLWKVDLTPKLALEALPLP